MAKIKRLSIFSFAKFQSVLFAILGLIVGFMYSFGGLIFDLLVNLGFDISSFVMTSGLGYGTILAFGALFGMPIIFAIFGFTFGVFEALLYNLFAKWF